MTDVIRTAVAPGMLGSGADSLALRGGAVA